MLNLTYMEHRHQSRMRLLFQATHPYGQCVITENEGKSGSRNLQEDLLEEEFLELKNNRLHTTTKGVIELQKHLLEVLQKKI